MRELFGDSVVHSYLPYDQPAAVRRFLDRARPRIAIIMETELWPSLYHECGRRSVPLVLASARVSASALIASARCEISFFSSSVISAQACARAVTSVLLRRRYCS